MTSQRIGNGVIGSNPRVRRDQQLRLLADVAHICVTAIEVHCVDECSLHKGVWLSADAAGSLSPLAVKQSDALIRPY